MQRLFALLAVCLKKPLKLILLCCAMPRYPMNHCDYIHIKRDKLTEIFFISLLYVLVTLYLFAACCSFLFFSIMLNNTVVAHAVSFYPFKAHFTCLCVSFIRPFIVYVPVWLGEYELFLSFPFRSLWSVIFRMIWQHWDLFGLWVVESLHKSNENPFPFKCSIQSKSCHLLPSSCALEFVISKRKLNL